MSHEGDEMMVNGAEGVDLASQSHSGCHICRGRPAFFGG